MRGGYTARSRPLGWAWVAVASYGISSAYADETAHKVSAEVLFEEGKRLVGSGQYDEACPKFAESRRREPGIGITLYLADCYERAGKTASAWVTFREAAAMAMASGQEQRERVARSRASALEPTLSRLMVVVEGSAASVAGLQVVRDTVALGKETWGVAMPVDPGIHRVQARAPGYVSFETSVSLVPSAGTVTHVEPTAGGSWLRTATVLGAGVGVAGLGLGVFFGARARHNLTVALRECDEGSPLQCSPAGVQQLARARESATFSNASFGVGLAGAASSLVFWILSPPARPHVPPTIAFRPALGSTFSGVQLNGHW